MFKKDDIILDKKKNKYKIIKAIGKGGMGHVILAKREKDEKEFAIKTLSDLFLENDSELQALKNEVTLAEQIKHPNVIDYIYFHSGEDYKKLPPYIIMELATDGTLQDLIDQQKENNNQFSQSEILNLLNMLINGMEAINEKLIHRDIKPSNILFKENKLIISDFGISKIVNDPTRTKSFKGSGTLAFLPPEVFANGKNTIQMDIYSMGIVFYLISTLNHPYLIENTINNEDDWKKAHLYFQAKNPKTINEELSPKLCAIIQKMMEKKPSNRYQDWATIREDLKGIDKLSSSEYSEVIEKMISQNIEKTSLKKQKELEETKKREEEEQKNKIIIYQFDNEIIEPLKKFVDDYNGINKLEEEQLSLDINDRETYPRQDKAYIIKSIDRSIYIEINIHIIDRMDYIERETRDVVFDETIKKTYRPEINGKEILAWGLIKSRNNTGLNIVLVKSDDNIYGEWYILKNTHNGLGDHRDTRPEPFPFELNELIKEVHHIGAMHIYVIQVMDYNSKIIIDYISEL